MTMHIPPASHFCCPCLARQIKDVKKALHVLKELADANEGEFVKLVAPKGVVACLLQCLSRMVRR